MSARIAKKLLSLPLYKSAGKVMFYVTLGSEVKTEKMMEQAFKDGKSVIVPKAMKEKRSLEAVQIFCPENDLKPGAYGVLEPDIERCKICAPDEIDLVLVPGVAFDSQGYRLGYGKGYYDSWMKCIPRTKRVGLAYGFQVVGKLPRESHDISVSAVITEKAVIKTVQCPLLRSTSYPPSQGFGRTMRKGKLGPRSTARKQ